MSQPLLSTAQPRLPIGPSLHHHDPHNQLSHHQRTHGRASVSGTARPLVSVGSDIKCLKRRIGTQYAPRKSPRSRFSDPTTTSTVPSWQVGSKNSCTVAVPEFFGGPATAPNGHHHLSFSFASANSSASISPDPLSFEERLHQSKLRRHSMPTEYYERTDTIAVATCTDSGKSTSAVDQRPRLSPAGEEEMMTDPPPVWNYSTHSRSERSSGCYESSFLMDEEHLEESTWMGFQ